MAELFLIKSKKDEQTFVHYDVATFEYWSGEGKQGAAIFTKDDAKDFLNKTGMGKDWELFSTGVKTSDTEK